MLGLDNPLHIAIVLIVVLMVFGAKRLPEMGKSMGEGLRGFKSAVTGDPADDSSPAGIDAAVPMPAVHTPVVADSAEHVPALVVVDGTKRVPAAPVA